MPVNLISTHSFSARHAFPVHQKRKQRRLIKKLEHPQNQTSSLEKPTLLKVGALVITLLSGALILFRCSYDLKENKWTAVNSTEQFFRLEKFRPLFF